MSNKKKGGGGLPGKDLTTPGSPRYHADLVGVAVRLPKDRVDLVSRIIRSRNEHARRDGRMAPVKLSEVIRYAFDLGIYEMQIREAVARMTSKARPFGLHEVAELVQLPEVLLRKELTARGVNLPPPSLSETPWPRADPPRSAAPSAEAIQEEPAPIDPVLVRPAP